MDKDFLLSTATAKHLYHKYAAALPIIDYHCHLNPQEIYEDRQFENITQIWLGGDHYKWRLMRWSGVDERYITGDAGDREKFQKWAEALGLAIGHPLYHWSHLELRNYFGYEGTLSGDTAEEVWQLCNEKLQRPAMSARSLIVNSGVKALCTTDDPADSLEWHKKIADDRSFGVKVLPSFRPDKALGLEKSDYLAYLEKLGKITSYTELVEALKTRLEFFISLGCRVSDHGMEAVPFAPATETEVEAIFQKRLRGERPTAREEKQFKTALLLALGREYHRRGVVMQLHFGVIRDNSRRVFRALGPDAGIDSIGDQSSIKELAAFLGALDDTDELPKTILYSLNPNDNAALVTVIGAFQTSEAAGKLQHGSAWWFNDHKQGMIDQLTTLAANGYLAGFVGMLTDSRSFLSYARHEYFRRILCELIGAWVENGEYPYDEEALRVIIERVCADNAARYFDLLFIWDLFRNGLVPKRGRKARPLLKFRHGHFLFHIPGIVRLVCPVVGLPYDTLCAEHRDAWELTWQGCDLPLVGGDAELQCAIRYTMLQLLCSCSAKDPTVSIGARGLTHGRYKGCYFWDVDLFMLPFFLKNDREAARSLCEYRVRALSAAKEHSRKMNTKGARYPWMAAMDGSEQCETWDIGCSELHVTADIVYALDQYCKETGDEEFYLDHAAEVYMETARFWVSRYTYHPESDTAELLFCKGPDEYCGVTSNNLFTNVMVQHNLSLASQAAEELRIKRPEAYQALGVTEDEINRWQHLREIIRWPRDPETGHLTTDDTFHLLEPVDLSQLKSGDEASYHTVCFDRLQRYKVVKQADVLLLMTRFPNLFTKDEKKQAWKDFEPICLHDSTLSFASHALFAAQNGMKEDAARYLQKALLLDLRDVMGNTGKEGLHLACMGEAWQATLFCTDLV